MERSMVLEIFQDMIKLEKMVDNPEQAIIIKTIFELFLQVCGATKIKYELERRGYPTATGKKDTECISNIKNFIKCFLLWNYCIQKILYSRFFRAKT